LHGYTDRVSLLDVKNITSSELKNKIARCEFIVASRYHSCVAALSAGVPLLVVGWHHKYDELLNYYDQKEWIISSDNCKSIDLSSKFDKLVQSKDEVMAKIQDRQYSVKQQIIKTYEQALSALWG
jgi:polysaccharide pyruvyl transferase WcaK-like protein